MRFFEAVGDDGAGGGQVQAPPAIDPAIEAEARRGGWKPKEEWRGRPEDWADAKAFVDHGRKILPHVQRHSARLEQENTRMREQQAAQAREIEELKGQIAGLTEFQAGAAKEAHARMRAEILAELKAARTAGDVDAEARAIDRLSQQPPIQESRPAGRNGSGSPQGGGTQPARAQIPQEMTDWVAQNEWYQRDAVLNQAMNIVGAELRASGKLVGMNLTEQLNTTAAEVLRRYAPLPAHSGPRVEGGGRPASGGGGGGGGVNSFQEAWDKLPARIKFECDAQGKRLGLVGKGKTFQTEEAWRKHYLQQYGRYSPGVGYDYRPVEDTRPAWMDEIDNP